MTASEQAGSATGRGRGASRASLLTLLLAVSSFVLTLALFTPTRIYAGNFMEFSFLFHESLLFFLALSLVVTVLVFAAVAASSRHPTACRMIISLLSAGAFLAWLQASIFVWNYGVLDGKDIPWSSLAGYGAIDSLLWTTLIAFAVWRSDLVARVSRALGAVLLAVQLVSVAQAWFAMPKDQSFKGQERATSTLFRFSDHVNVIVLVLDTFQSDIFQDIIREDAELRASFDGFTYFRNALAGSDGTIVSIPNLLTATNYDNSVPYLEYVKNAYLAHSLPRTMHEYGFAIDLYPILPYSVWADYSGIPRSGKRLMNWRAFFEEQAFLADLALFRCAPHTVKELIYNRQRWSLSDLVKRLAVARACEGPGPSGSYQLKYAREFANSRKLIARNWDASFINKAIPLSETMEGTDAFKFYHLNGIHLSLMMNEDLAYEELQPVRADMKRQGTAVLKIAAMLLERLKQLGVYDNSLIFIVGDHGSGISDAGINLTAHAASFNRSGPYKGNFKTFKAAGIPLILAKRMHATGELATSEAPVALGDLPQTVAEELGLDARFPGESMFRLEENAERERIYRAFVGPQEDVEYLAPLWEYAVNGHSWDDTSWSETGNVYYAPSK